MKNLSLILSISMCCTVAYAQNEPPQGNEYVEVTSRPGPDDSTCQYVYNAFGCSSSSPYVNIGSQVSYLPNELPAVTWSEGAHQCDSGIWRSFLDFPEIADIPSTAKIDSAILFLYGMDNKNLTMAQGNSIYPGSPYSSQGSNEAVLKRVLQPWKRSTLNWNNQPSASNSNTVKIPMSNLRYNYDVVLNVTQLVQDMVDSSTRNGFMFMQKTEAMQRSLGFWSNFVTDSNKRPVLKLYYHTPTAINENLALQNDDVRIYPNPATQNLWISFNRVPQKTITYRVFNMSGKELISGNAGTTTPKVGVPVADLPRGIYLLHISDGESVLMKRFSKL